MDEAHIILNIFALLVAIAGGWFLFRDIHSNGESVDAAREQSCDAQAEQREDGEALRSVSDGLEESSAAVSDMATYCWGIIYVSGILEKEGRRNPALIFVLMTTV